MNEVQIFNFEANEVRTVFIENEAWFVGKDVADALGYSASRNALSKHVDNDDKLTHQISASGQKREMTLINESGVYSLIFGSKLESAKRFKKWVTSEVLPSIRKHGAYMDSETIEKVLTDPDTIIKIATDLKREKEARVKAEGKVIEMQPKAEYYDKVLETTNSVVVTQIAKDYGYSARKFNELLQSMGVQYRVGGQWVLKAQYQDKGYTETKTVHTMNCGRTFSTVQTRWTQKGRHFLYELLEKNNIVPLRVNVQ